MADADDHGGTGDGRRVAASIRYHALGPLVGEPGIAVTFDDGGRFGTGAIVILDRYLRGSYACLIQVDAGDDPGDLLRRAISEWGNGAYPVRDRDAVSRAFPGPDDPGLADSAWEIADGDADRFRDAQRAAARAFLREADVPAAMRDALHAALDHGVPPAIGGLRHHARVPAPPNWDAFAFTVENPMVGWLIMQEHPLLAAKSRRPWLDFARERWPGLTRARLQRIAATGDTLLERLRERDERTATDLADAMVGVIARLPLEWIPDRHGMRDFITAALPSAALARKLGLDVLDHLGPGGADWSARVAALADVADGLRTGPYGDMGAADATDVSMSLADTVTIPLLARERMDGDLFGRLGPIARPLAAKLVFGRKSLPSVLAISKEWHACSDAISLACRVSAAAIAWPRLLPAPLTVGDIRFVPVNDFAGLQAEGAGEVDADGLEGLSHCIATRLPRLSGGMSHVLSVRTRGVDGTWVRHSTLQVRVGPIAAGSHWMAVEEHRGFDNADPGPEAIAATSRLAEMFLRGEVAPIPESLVIRQPSGNGRIEVACGYDWTDEASVLAAVRAWSDFLPRWTRGLDAAGLVEAMVANGCLTPTWREDILASDRGLRAAA